MRKIARSHSDTGKAEKVAAGTIEWVDPILHRRVGCASQ
jgi:hypothetical protein